MTRRDFITLSLLLLLAAGVVLLRLYAVGAPLDASVSTDARDQILSLRLIRIGAGAAVGACLAVAGVMLQSLMRNPLASPDLMGMSAGAGLAVLLSRAGLMWFGGVAATGAGVVAGISSHWEVIPALVGAMLTLLAVFSLSQRRGLVDPTWLVLIGVMVGVLCGAGIMLVQHLAPGVNTGGSIRVLIGSLSDETSTRQVAIAAAVALAGIAVGLLLGPSMDAGALDADEALSVGVAVRRVRIGLLLTSGVLTATAVALAGPLGFVGLVCPHAVRLLGARGRSARATNNIDHNTSLEDADRHGVRNNARSDASSDRFIAIGWWGIHRVRILGSALAGVILVVGGDAVVSAISAANPHIGRIPLGVVMAFIGAPAFVLLLRTGMTRRSLE